MDMEAGKTLTNEEVIRELLELLKKNAMKEQANDVFEICSYVDGLEKKIDSMTEELTSMQNQVKEMQELYFVLFICHCFMLQKVCFSLCDIARDRADLLQHGFLLKERWLYGFWVCKSFC